MEALAEQIVATYLTRGGKVFIVPQYAIPAPTGKGDWACPDIVALDFGAKEMGDFVGKQGPKRKPSAPSLFDVTSAPEASSNAPHQVTDFTLYGPPGFVVDEPFKRAAE